MPVAVGALTSRPFAFVLAPREVPKEPKTTHRALTQNLGRRYQDKYPDTPEPAKYGRELPKLA